MIKENDLVRTMIEKEGFPAGTKGVVVSAYSSSPACEVEVWNENDYPADVVTYRFEELIPAERFMDVSEMLKKYSLRGSKIMKVSYFKEKSILQMTVRFCDKFSKDDEKLEIVFLGVKEYNWRLGYGAEYSRIQNVESKKQTIHFTIKEYYNDKNCEFSFDSCGALVLREDELFTDRLTRIDNPTHNDVFNVIKTMMEEGISFDNLMLFDANLIERLLFAYYEEYDMRKYDDKRNLISIEDTEVLLPLEERPSGIIHQLEWLLEKGYDINTHVMIDDYDEDRCDFLDFPSTIVFAIPYDVYMAEWFLSQGCGRHLMIEVGDNETLADWCFDNLDLRVGELLYTEVDVTKVFKITADLIRLLLKHGCKYREGMYMTVDEDNMVRFHFPNYRF